MRHLIIGKGNLGLDLAITLTDVEVVTQSENWQWRTKLDPAPEFIWCCAGAGSVQEAQDWPHVAFDTHVLLPISMARMYPKSRIIAFSSDYAVEPKSLYAVTKKSMEDSLHYYNNATVIRIGSLYGHHRPRKTFPGKLLVKYSKLRSLTLPVNAVTPTPTAWVAEILSRHTKLFRDNKILNCAPREPVEIWNWGQHILKGYDILPGDLDQNRPTLSNIGCDFETAPHWFALWKQYYHSHLYR